MKRAQPGFTLLELMLVVAIAGILLAIGFPAMGNFIRNSRITSAANDVMAGLHFTRSEAIKRRLPVTLCTSTSAVTDPNPTCAASPLLTGWIAFVDTNQSGQRDAAEVVLMQHEAMNAQITARSSVDPFQVTYLLNGFALNPNAAQLVLCDERGNTPTGGELSSARGILVSVTGRAGVTRELDEIQGLGDARGGGGGGGGANRTVGTNMKRIQATRPAQSGFTMVEVLVALVVLAIGLLGIAALYLNSLQSGRTAIYRTQAVNLAADLADRIRMNRTAQAAYGTLFADAEVAVPACSTTGGCTDADLAATDLSNWKTTVALLLPNGQGQVAVTAPVAAGEPANYIVTVRWAEVGEAAPVTFLIAFAT
jgi:type IV pilus modification protein PilV